MIWLELDSVWTKNFGNALFICVVLNLCGFLIMVNFIWSILRVHNYCKPIVSHDMPNNEHHGVSDHWQLNLTICSTDYSDKQCRKHQSSALLGPLALGIHRLLLDSPHKWPVVQKVCPCHDNIMYLHMLLLSLCDFLIVVNLIWSILWAHNCSKPIVTHGMANMAFPFVWT